MEPAYKAATITAPACWASYLVNGESRDMDPVEKSQADAWMISNRVCYVHSVEGDPWFTWSYRVHNPLADCTGGEVADYVCSVAP